jgi:hypothetical protein
MAICLNGMGIRFIRMKIKTGSESKYKKRAINPLFLFPVFKYVINVLLPIENDSQNDGDFEII